MFCSVPSPLLPVPLFVAWYQKWQWSYKAIKLTLWGCQQSQNIRTLAIIYLQKHIFFLFLDPKGYFISLGKILFISRSKALYFGHAKIWWSNITTKLSYLLLLQAKLSRRKILISSCIWNFFCIKMWIIIFVFNSHLLWYSCVLIYP